MMRAHDDYSDGPFELNWIPELRELLTRLCDDQLTESDGRRLNEILDDQADARKYYLKYMAVHSSLAALSGGTSAADAELAVERMTLARFAGRLDQPLLPACGVAPAQSSSRSRLRTIFSWATGIAAVLLVSLFLWQQLANDSTNESLRNVVAIDGTSGAAGGAPAAGPMVAEVTYVSSAADWQNPNSSFTLASRVRAGQSLVLTRGQVELTYGTGAKLLLTGPSEFLVLSAGGKLRRGELVARVPEAGHGFTIETPHGKVIDLGTEFGVVVDDFGVSQVSVFEGKVETLPIRAAGRRQDKIELTSGRAIQWTADSITPISVQGGRYRRSDDDPSSATSTLVADVQPLVDVDWRAPGASLDDWQLRGDVLATRGGLRMQSIAGQRPYLVSTQELDPANGAITIVCDLVLETVFDAEHASFAILTRSSDQPSKPGTPWHDMLARGVRCRLMADLLSGEGMLEAGTKYEADREHTNISWGGFSQPRPGARYRLEMRDDGLNVWLTVSLADNPSVRKTITCRSLFRGNQNFVALEGPSTGAALVERLTIVQDADVSARSRMLSLQMDAPTEDELSGRELTTRLDEFAPPAAELVLRDAFDNEMVDPDKWQTLGDVVVEGGEAQLGLPNRDGHIDTWKARPYLLTRQQFDPANGPLTIVGHVTFAENFLHGYGGSFAVMTRADDTRGGGPSWENSILRRGVRSNFWPAAYGFDHSLEIHEKPAPNTISLLLAEGFRIAPTARSYLFKVVDNGHAAELTFVDAADPTIRKTVSHATSSTSLRSGHVAFEGCWGSPMRLDEVRIYRQLSETAVDD